MNRSTLRGALVGFLLCGGAALAEDAAPTAVDVLRAVARDIEAIKWKFPQLADFSVASLDPERMKGNEPSFSYGYRIHPAKHAGGWTAAVPNPDPDGVWFYIDIHDPDSQAQIHTQPEVASLCWGKQRVSFLILDGSATKPIAARIYAILKSHGVLACPRHLRASRCHAGEVRIRPYEASRLASTVSVGWTAERVLDVLGEPTGCAGDIWVYVAGQYDGPRVTYRFDLRGGRVASIAHVGAGCILRESRSAAE